MPTIPDFAESKNAFPDAPPSIDVRPERFGRDLEAMSQFGGQVADFGSKLMQARKSALEADAVANKKSETNQWLGETESSLRLSYQKTNDKGEPLLGPDGQAIYDVEGFSTALKQKLDKRMEEDMKTMPTGDAQRMYRESIQPVFDRSYVGGIQWENITRTETYRKNIDIRISTNANFLINNPNLENTRRSLDELRETTNSQIGTVLTPGEAQETYRKGAKVYVDALFRGYAQSPAKAKEGLAILNHISEMSPVDPATGKLIMSNEKDLPAAGTKMGKNAAGQEVISGGGMKSGMFGSGIDPQIVQTSLAPDDIDRIRQRLLGVTEEAGKFEVADLRSKLQSHKAMMTDLDPTAKNYFSHAENQKMIQGFNALAANKKISQAEADEAAVTLTLGTAHMQVRDQMWSMAPSQMKHWDEMLAKEYTAELKNLGIEDKAFSYEHNRTYKQITNQLKEKIMTERKKDPAGYIEAHFSPQAKGSISQDGIPDDARINWRAAMAKNLEMGAPPLTGGEQASLVRKMKKAAEESPEAAAATLSAIRGNKYSGAIMEQLTGKGGLDESFKSAYYAADDEAAASMISNLKKDNKEALLDSINPVDRKELKGIVEKEFASTKKVFNAQGPWARNNKFAESLKEATYLEAINIKNASGASLEDSYKQAADKIINNRYHIVDTTFIPKQVGDVVTNTNYIKGEMDVIHSPEYQKSLNLSIPKSTPLPGENPEQKKAREMSESKSLSLAIERGRWVTRPDTLGARYMIPKGNQWQPLMKKDGSTVDIDFAKASVNPSEGALEYNKPWFEKVFGGSAGKKP